MLPYQRFQKTKNQQNQKSQSLQSNSSLDILKGKEFWIWDKTEHLKTAVETNKQCCAQHIWGLPRKNNKEYPLFPFQKRIFDTIENNQNIFILKSRGIGLTTLAIRYFAWKILSSNELDNKSIFIVSGTREEHANYIKQKLEELFYEKFPAVRFESKYTELLLNKTWVKVFPTRNIKDIRGYMDVAYVFCDEIDYLEDSIQGELMHAISPYEEKSNCKIILCSTPFKPNGLMQRIENDPNSKYVKLKIDFTYGLDTIYDREFIEKKKLDVEFQREYNCAYIGFQGDCFHARDIQRCIDDSYDPDLFEHSAIHIMGLDSGFSSSSFGLVVLEYLNHRIYVKICEEYNFVRYEDICHKIKSILLGLNRWSLDQTQIGATKVMVDEYAPEFVRSLKLIVGENDNPNYIKSKIEHAKKYNRPISDFMTICPYNFGAGGAQSLLLHTKTILEFDKRPLIAISSRHDKLLTALRTAVCDDLGRLDKNQTVHNDVLDSFMLALKFFSIKQKDKQNQRPIVLSYN